MPAFSEQAVANIEFLASLEGFEPPTRCLEGMNNRGPVFILNLASELL